MFCRVISSAAASAPLSAFSASAASSATSLVVPGNTFGTTAPAPKSAVPAKPTFAHQGNAAISLNPAAASLAAPKINLAASPVMNLPSLFPNKM